MKVIEDNTDKVQAAMSVAIQRALEKVGLVAERNAKMLCPVDTGNLRRRTTHVVDNDSMVVAIGTNVEYGPYVELGSSKGKYKGANGGKGYLRPAVYEHTAQYRKIIESELKGA